MNQLHKNTIWNGLAAILNAAQSVIVIMIASRLNDINVVGMLSIGFSLANLFLMIGKFGIRYYQIAHEGFDISGRNFWRLRVITTASMAAAAVIYIVIKTLSHRYSAEKSFIVFGIIIWYIVEAFEDHYIGNYQVENRLDVGNRLFIFRWIAILASFTVVEVCTRNIAAAIAVADLAAVCVEIILLRATTKIFDPHDCQDVISFRDMLLQISPIALGSFISFYISNMQKYAIDSLLDDRVQAIYGYVSIITFALPLLNGVIYQPQLAYYIDDLRNGRMDAFRKRMRRQQLLLALMFLLALIFIFFAGVPILSWMYNTDLYPYRINLILFWVGGWFLAWGGFHATILIITGKQLVNMIIYIVVGLIGTPSAYLLIYRYGLMGATFSYCLTMLVQALALIVSLHLVIKSRSRDLREGF